MSEVVITKETEVVSLTNILNESACKYYNGLIPTLSDNEYDAMLERLEILEKETGLQLPNSPLRRVGFEVLDSIPKKKLPQKMLSLDKLKNNDFKGLMKWMGNKICILTLKLDGLSCMLEYKEGKLIGAYTRGNGIEGSNVTEIVSSLPSVPNYIENFSGLVVGEVLIRKSNFDRVNKIQQEKGLPQFANPRNLASGTLMSLDTKLGRDRGLEFIGFDIFDINGYYVEKGYNDTQENKLCLIKDLGFQRPAYDLFGGVESQIVVEGYIDALKRIAELDGLPIDGIVIGINNMYEREVCKPTSKYPTHSIAFKFTDEYEDTVLRDIEWSMSRNEILTPVAIFDTVILDGTEVSRANIHNVSILRALELGIGDTIRVVKANQIIPQVVKNLTKSDTYELPSKCPYCNGDIEIIGENSLEIKCTNINCQEHQVLKINHFLSKEALNAKGVSEKIIKKLMSFGEIENIYDVLALPKKREELIKKNYPSFGRKAINNICDAIEKASNTTLDRFLIGLGIEHLGVKVSRDIVKKYPSIDELLNMTIDGLKTIGGIDATARSIYNQINNNREHIEKLLKYVNIENKETNMSTGNALEGKVFVFTGKTKEFKNRKFVEEFVIENGGKMASSVSSKTSYLICNEVETTSKYKKAQELGIEIISDSQLKEMVK